jgi:rhodanese-related sulfurtransferase
MTMIPELSARELEARLKGPNPPLLVDVREPHEWRLCRIPGAELRPMSQIMSWMDDLDKSAEIVFQCHTGVRSLQVAHYLKANGFERVFNLRGGIEAWAVEVDPGMPRY